MSAPTLLFVCPRCRGPFRAADDWLGRQVACPHCEGAVTLPVASQVTDETTATVPRVARTGEAVEAEIPQVEVDDSDRSGSRSATPSPVDQLLAARRQPDESRHASPFAVHDRPPVVTTRDGRRIVVRQRTPEEKERFRQKLNVAVGGCGLLLLIAVLLVLVWAR